SFHKGSCDIKPMDSKIEKYHMRDIFESRIACDPGLVPLQGKIYRNWPSNNTGADSFSHIAKMRCPSAVLVYRYFYLIFFGNFYQSPTIMEIKHEGFLA